MKRMLLLIGSFMLYTTAWAGQKTVAQARIQAALDPLVRLPETVIKIITDYYHEPLVWQYHRTIQMPQKAKLICACLQNPKDKTLFLAVTKKLSGEETTYKIDLMPYNLTHAVLSEPVYTFKKHTKPISELLYSPRHDTLISVEDDTQCDVKKTQQLCFLKVNSPPKEQPMLQKILTGSFFNLKISPNEEYCAAIQLKKQTSDHLFNTHIVLLSLSTLGTPPPETTVASSLYFPNYQTHMLAWKDNDTLILYGTSLQEEVTKGKIIVFDLKKKTELCTLNTEAYSLTTYVPEYNHLYGYVRGKSIHVLPILPKQNIGTITYQPWREPVQLLTSPDSSWVFAVSMKWFPAEEEVNDASLISFNTEEMSQPRYILEPGEQSKAVEAYAQLFFLSPQCLGVFGATTTGRPLHIIHAVPHYE